MKSVDPWSIIPSRITSYWRQKYGDYLCVYTAQDVLIFVENGTLDSFHPSGDRLAIHRIENAQTMYIWNNKVTNLLTETEYLEKINGENQIC